MRPVKYDGWWLTLTRGNGIVVVLLRTTYSPMLLQGARNRLVAGLDARRIRSQGRGRSYSADKIETGRVSMFRLPRKTPMDVFPIDSMVCGPANLAGPAYHKSTPAPEEAVMMRP
jgi:hypothetical protein